MMPSIYEPQMDAKQKNCLTTMPVLEMLLGRNWKISPPTLSAYIGTS